VDLLRIIAMMAELRILSTLFQFISCGSTERVKSSCKNFMVKMLLCPAARPTTCSLLSEKGKHMTDCSVHPAKVSAELQGSTTPVLLPCLPLRHHQASRQYRRRARKRRRMPWK